MHSEPTCDFIGRSKPWRHLLKLSALYGPTNWPVLILGETGVGKELLARRLHACSPRCHAPFVPVNCGAIPAGLFESEIFGHEKGAFSGALTGFRGLARLANGGTLFLDEVGDMDFSLQVKMLRLIDRGEVRSVGSSRVETVDVRILAATNVNLSEAIHTGKFRHDLLERLSVLSVHIPPLRERPEDILPIARHLLRAWEVSVPDRVLEELQSFPWPGNVRQLRNVLIRASVEAAHGGFMRALERVLSQEKAVLQPAPRRHWLEGSLSEIEKKVIVHRLKRCRGNRKRTAEELGIAKSTLQEKIRRWKQSDPRAQSWPLVLEPVVCERPRSAKLDI